MFERDCIQEGPEERPLMRYLVNDWGYRYSMENCLYDKTMLAILEACGCHPKGFSPKGTDECNMSDDCPQAQLREFGQRTDLDVVVTKSNTGATTVRSKCLPACEDQSMGNLQVSTKPNAPSPQDIATFCTTGTFGGKLRDNSANWREYACAAFMKKNFVSFKVYFSEPFAIRYAKRRRLTLDEIKRLLRDEDL